MDMSYLLLIFCLYHCIAHVFEFFVVLVLLWSRTFTFGLFFAHVVFTSALLNVKYHSFKTS